MSEEGRVHPDCQNASNPYHECSEYCFKIIAETKKRIKQTETGVTQPNDCSDAQALLGDNSDRSQNDQDEKEDTASPIKDLSNLTGREKKLHELRLKMNAAQKANQSALVEENRKTEAPEESRGMSKKKWLEERKKKLGKLLDANGLVMSKAYMLDTQESAEAKYKKWEKEPAPAGWDVFNQKTLYNAHKKRTKNIEVDFEEYNKMKEVDPEFYREASSLQYGKAPKVSDDRIERMVKELKDKEEKRKSFSRRRRYREEKDIDSINDRNEHFNKKIERAFGKYTLEIKNNLERGTALPD
ncbi:unnamed protein product [Cuscuta epithymum]|uniref:Pre-mRNA-splicing factor SYF2 n=1 Tax=Cuscuta epithymum TaxID=186058 RepID=A0AAV0F0T4_9ASTE|nr:unnamed protein product [Cuscuta epithymum]CAH9129032.1 unnamed protein product [Cuscuta epithymum]